MNKEKNFNMGHITIEALGASIASLLLKEGKVVIPELGYLELKVFPDKRSVLFKATENAALFLDSEGLIQSSIYNSISVPLKEGKSVTLPEVGIFRTMKNADGSSRVSYTMSSALRELLNGTKESENVVKKPGVGVCETLPKANNEKPLKTINERRNKEEEEKSEKSELIKQEKTVVSVSTSAYNTSKVGDLVVPQEGKKRNVVGMRSLAIALVAIVVLVFIVWYFTSESTNKSNDYASVSGNNKATLVTDQSLELTKSDESIDLPSLAEQKYGNRIFWIYIYEANRDKISSPVNIPAGIKLRIPNLLEDYKVDVTDSMEIKRAGILSDIILKQKIQL